MNDSPINEHAKSVKESRHILNKVKYIIAYSDDYDDAINNLRRKGYPRGFRSLCVEHYKSIIGKPDMSDVGISPINGYPWWIELHAKEFK